MLGETRAAARRLIVVLAAAAIAVTCAATAQGEVTHLPLFRLGDVPAQGPHGEHVPLPGSLERMESMTVDAGHLWVAERVAGGASRVDEFDAATGAFLSQPVAVESAAAGEPPSGYGEDFGEGIAVGHGTGSASLYVGGESHGVGVVSVFDESGALEANWTGGATPGGSFGTITDVAADNSNSPLDAGRGDVFVAARLGNAAQVEIFHPEANGEEHYVGRLTGASPSEPFENAKQIAVDEANGDLLVFDQLGGSSGAVVDVFEPTGLGAYAFVRKIGGPPPSGQFTSTYAFAVDSSNGDVFVTEFAPEGDYVHQSYLIDEFTVAGAYLGHVEDIPDAFSIAIDPSSHDLYARELVYGPDVVVPDVATGSISALKPESVTLSGAVNPGGVGAASCFFAWGASRSLGNVAPCSQAVPDGESSVGVQASLTGLARNATYYYRLEASNTNGTNPGEPRETREFATHGVAVDSEWSSDVATTSATLGATVNPGGKAPTSFYFQYGPSTAYGQNAPAPPGEEIEGGVTDVEAPHQHVQGLTPDTVYHYRAVAVSEVQPGEVETVYSPDRTFTTPAAGRTFSLPDGRRWELVSPANKLGALIGPLGGVLNNVVQAAKAGNAIAYRASSPTEDEPSGYARTVEILSTRAGTGWSSQDIGAPHDQGGGAYESIGAEYRLFSEDLSHAAVQPASSAFTPLSPEASEATAYLRTDYLGGNVEEHCFSECYRPLVTGKPGFADVPSGTIFGEEPNGYCKQYTCGPFFEGANADMSALALSSPVQLTATPAPAGAPGLYEWSAGSLRLLDVLPKGEEGPATLAGVGSRLGVRNAISEDGERVVLEGGASGGNGLYLRDFAAGETIRLDVPQGGAGPSREPIFMDATGDDSKILFLDSGPLTAGSSASGSDLYEYDLDAPPGSRLKDLTDPAAGQAADAQTVIGESEDGSYVYFAAGGALAPGAVADTCEAFNFTGACNLYVRHEGVTRLIARLPIDDLPFDLPATLRSMVARVSSNGQWLAFMSAAELTGYDAHDAVSGQPDAEVYLYHAATNAIVCASCDPTGARPTGQKFVSSLLVGASASGGEEAWAAANVPPWTGPHPGVSTYQLHQPRYLSDTGRLFFDSDTALVPQDVNGTEDVYEYDPVGVGDCSPSSKTFALPADGCLDLISGGASPVESAFLDAGEAGGDVFFLTQEKLTSQDYDDAYDVYDAHECTSAAPCASLTAQPSPCVTEASCKAAPTPQPALFGVPASATFSGTGNLVSSPRSAAKPKSKPKPISQRCRKSSSKHRCVPANRAKHKHRKRGKSARSRHGGKR